MGGVSLNQSLVLATNQTIQFQSMQITKGPTSLIGQVVFAVLDQNGKQVSSFTVQIPASMFNAFWEGISNANAAQYLYQMGLTSKGSQVSVPSTVSQDFINT